jgi:heme/copper-type cytochrome/quinol oxidase subunit 2
MELKVNIIMMLSATLIFIAVGALVLLRENLRKYEYESEEIKNDASYSKPVSIFFAVVAAVMYYMSEQIPLESVWTFAGAFVAVVIAILTVVWVWMCRENVRRYKESHSTKES